MLISASQRLIFALYLIVFVQCSQAKALSSERLSLKPGLWEGIEPSTMHYRFLRIGDKGEHALGSVAISSGLHKGTTYPFTTDDIKCSSSECIIEFPRGNKGKKRLIISPYLDSSFMVLDIPVDDKNQSLAQSTYQLDAANDGSALTNFLATYPKAVIQTLSKLNSDTDIAGLWVGRLTMDDKPQLLTLAVYPDQQSNFTLHLVGKDYVNRTTFMPPDIRQQDGVFTLL